MILVVCLRVKKQRKLKFKQSEEISFSVREIPSDTGCLS